MITHSYVFVNRNSTKRHVKKTILAPLIFLLAKQKQPVSSCTRTVSLIIFILFSYFYGLDLKVGKRKFYIFSVCGKFRNNIFLHITFKRLGKIYAQ